MFAAAGGASLAKRHARRNVKKHPQPQGAVAAAAAAAALHHQQQQIHAHHGHLQPTLGHLHPAIGHHQHLYRAPSSRRVSRVSSFCDINAPRLVGVASLEVVEGKAAWQERELRELREREREREHIPGADGERRCSTACEAGASHRQRSSEARRRWMRRNRIHDASYGGSSDEDDVYGSGSGYGAFPFGQESAAANALLYVGLGTVAVGMVIAFVGTGEKGFKTLELRLIGPTLIGGGVLCCLLRILLCVCPSRCLLRRFRHRGVHKKKLPVGVSSAPAPSMGTASLVGAAVRVCDPAAERLLLAPPMVTHAQGASIGVHHSYHRSKKRVSLADAPSMPSTSRSCALSAQSPPSANPMGPSLAPAPRKSSLLAISHGSTGDVPLLAAVDADAEGDGDGQLHHTDSGSLNGAFTADEAVPFHPKRSQPGRLQPPVPLVHLSPALTPASTLTPPKAIIVTSPTPTPSPAASPATSSRKDSARELILSPGHLTRL